jgi:hypothetical protein
MIPMKATAEVFNLCKTEADFDVMNQWELEENCKWGGGWKTVGFSKSVKLVMEL